MKLLKEFAANLERQHVQITCRTVNSKVEADEFIFEGYLDEEDYLNHVKDLYAKCIRGFNADLKKLKSIEDRRIYVTEVVRTFRKANKVFEKKTLYDELLEVKRPVITSSKIAVNYPLDNGSELSDAQLVFLAEPFIESLADYGERLLEHVIIFRELFPEAIETGSGDDSLTIPDLYWKGNPGPLVEVLWTMIKGGYLYKNKAKTTAAEQTEVMKLFSSLFHINLSNHDDLIRSALRRDRSREHLDILKKLHDRFKKEQESAQQKKPQG